MIVEVGRRDLLRLSGASLALALLADRTAAAAGPVAPVATEPHHHVIFQNDVVRIMRVLIPPGEQTGWHEHRADYVSVSMSTTTVRVETQAEGQAATEAMRPGSVQYGDFQTQPAVQRITNDGTALYQAVAFEILRREAGNFGKADRSEASPFELVLDKPRIRAWRLQLEPGRSTPNYVQNGPGLRIVLAGERLIDTKPGELGRENPLRAGEAVFLPPATRSLTNAADGSLDLIECELR